MKTSDDDWGAWNLRVKVVYPRPQIVGLREKQANDFLANGDLWESLKNGPVSTEPPSFSTRFL